MNRTKANTTVGYKVPAFWFLVAVAVMAVAVAAVAFSAPALSAAKPAKTVLTIRAQGTDLSGTVRSQRLRCLGNRAVRLYKQQGRQQKPRFDTLIATDTSERRGKIGVWSTGNTGMTGKFYVRTGKVAGCRAGFSKTILVRP